MRGTIRVLFMLFLLSLFAANLFANPHQLNITNVGKLTLIELEKLDYPSTQLLFEREGGAKEIIDTYDGLFPASIQRVLLTTPSDFQIMVLLSYPGSTDQVLYLYDSEFEKIEPIDKATLKMRSFFFYTTYNGQPAICARNLISYHDFGPPELFELEFYKISGKKLELIDVTLSKSDHYNVLMNRGAYFFYRGLYAEAIDNYNLVIASSTGDISSEAFIDTVFFLAESHKFIKNFKKALDLYQKVVLDFGSNYRTFQAQKEIELISENIDELEILSLYIDIKNHLNCQDYDLALALIKDEQQIIKQSKMYDSFLFMNAEILTALNYIDEAIEMYNKIYELFPESNLLDEAEDMIHALSSTLEESDGI